MKFTNSENGYTGTSGGGLSWLWVFLFSPIYWAIKKVWRHAVVHLALALMTFGTAHFVYPFHTYSTLRKHYLKSGWKPSIDG